MSAGAGHEVARIVDHLGMEAHPEGGWYRRTWTAGTTSADGGRAEGSSILYLLAAGQRSHWHRIDAAELWCFASGAPLELQVSNGDEAVARHTLGADVLAGQVAQTTVEPWHWQSARSLGPWSLVSCVVVPEFRFDGFELAPPGWEPGRG